ncbi:MAG: AarF/ABC1/UbiB kinase family protein [Myxococcales bacterium]|nr:AarF/ABC1/UbiB kinase family protein [Myxococcales bacterium]
MGPLSIILIVLGALLLLSVVSPTLRRVWGFHLLVLKYMLFGLGDVLRVRPLILKLSGKRYVRLTRPMALRLFCEDMGVTFVKFGQIIASSSGVFPQPYVEEFQKVLDRVRPFDFALVEQTIEEELGESASRLANIQAKPLASASVAQVHSAELLDGTNVVLKVQRPGIDKVIDADMRIMRFFAIIARKVVKDAELFNPVGIVEDLAGTLIEETDFRKEANNLEQFNQIMEQHGHARVHAPVPQWDLVTKRVLVMERFYGTRVDDVEGLGARGVDAEDALVEGMQAWFQCVLFHGFFHGDVHAGNLMLLDNEDLGFLDFGIVGRFDDIQRYQVTDYMIGFATSDFKKVAEVISQMGGVSDGVNMEIFAEDLKEVYTPLLTMSFSEVNYANIIPKINEVARKHRMTMPKEFVLITKQLLYFDRYAKLLAPTLNIFTDPRLMMSMMNDIVKVRQELSTKAPN